MIPPSQTRRFRGAAGGYGVNPMAKSLFKIGDTVALRGVTMTVVESLATDPPKTIRCEWVTNEVKQSGYFDASKVEQANFKNAPLIVKPKVP